MNPDSGAGAERRSRIGGGPGPKVAGARAHPSPEGSLPGAGTGLGWRNTFGSLANRDYLYVWLGIILMIGGSEMEMIARGWLVYKITGSGAILGIVSAGASMPLLATALFGGAVADRVNRKRLLLQYQVISSTVSIFIAVSITVGFVTWPLLLATAMIQGASWSFAWPARQALIPELVGKERLGNALALNAAGMSATAMVLPAFAGLIYTLAGPDSVFYVTGAMGLVAVPLTLFIRHRDTPGRKSAEPVLRQISAALRYVIGSRLLLALLAIGLMTSLMSSPFASLLPVLVSDVYGRATESYGLLISAMGVGALVGALAVASIGRWHRGWILAIGVLVTGLCMLLVAFIPVYVAAVGILVVMGMFSAASGALKQALLIERVDDRYRGRVLSFMMMYMGVMPLSLILAGIAVDVLGVRVVVGLLGVGLLATFAVVSTTQQQVTRLE